MVHMDANYPQPTLFHLFTKESLTKIEQAIQAAKEKKAQEKLEAEQEGGHANIKDDDKPRPDPQLEAGLVLPTRYINDFPSDLYGKPIEDIDPYYHNKYTFMVVGKDNNMHRFSATNGLFLLTPFNPLRRIAILIFTHQLFGLFIITVIVLNCIFMASKIENPHAEKVFTAIYTIEGALKILARGFLFAPFTYLRDAWNWLDFVVVSLAYVERFIKLGNLAALRTVRVLRALKTVAIVPGLKTIVSALMEAVRRLRDVMILTVFVLSIFALVGLQVYQGVLRQKCILLPDGWSRDEFYAMDESFIDEYASNSSRWYNVSGVPKLCGEDGSEAGQCIPENEYDPRNFTCIKIGGNPNMGYTSFDSFPWALLCAFRLMTQDYWENLYQIVIRAQGPWHMLFFILVIFMGSFYLVNLILAIVAMSYDEQQKQDEEDEEEEEHERQQAAMLAMHMVSRSPSQAGSICVFAEDDGSMDGERRFSIVNRSGKKNSLSLPSSPLIDRHSTRASQLSLKRRVLRSPRMNDRTPLVFPGPFEYNFPYADDSRAATPSQEDIYSACNTHIYQPPRRRLSSSTSHKSTVSTHSVVESRRIPRSRRASFTSDYIRFPQDTTKTRGLIDRLDRRNLGNQEPTHFHWPNKNSVKRTVPDVVVDKTRGDNESSSSQCDLDYKMKLFADNPFICRTPSTTVVEYNDVMLLKSLVRHASHRGSRMSFISDRGMTRKERIKQTLLYLLWGWECSPCWHKFAHYVELFIMDAFVDLFITLCIVVNTAFMASDHYDMNPEFAMVLLNGNYVFTAIFTAEAVLKIIALNPMNYLKDKWNCFDIVIVILSLVELGLQGVKGLSILRSFRLLRVFKLAKSWPTLNLLIGIIGRTMGALGNLCIVLAIIIFIFAVMGMQLFGEGYTKLDKFPNGPPRWNFVDFLHSFMIIFRVLCGEWIESMWDCMWGNSIYTCVPFFLLTNVIASLVVLNLFLALLLSSFGAESLQNSTDESEPNKLQEAVNRINRFVIFVKSRTLYCIKVRFGRGRIEMDWDNPYGPHGASATKMNGDAQNRVNYNGRLETMAEGDEPSPQHTTVSQPRLFPGNNKSHVGYSPVSPYEPSEDSKPLDDGTVSVASSRQSVVSRSASAESGLSTRSASSSRDSDLYTSNSTVPREDAISVDRPIDTMDGPEINEVEVVFVQYPDDCCPQCCVKRCACFDKISKTNIGQRWWQMRCYMFKMVEHKYFETFIITMIITSSLALAVEDKYYDERPTVVMIMTYLDKFYTVIFVLEMFLKWTAFGFKKYFTDSWCWLDFVIVSISLITLAATQIPTLKNMSGLKALRTLRALRPLRAVSRWEGMKVVVNALIGAIPAIANVLVVCLVFWLIFAIMGVNLFNGRFGQCLDENNVRLPVNVTENKTRCYEEILAGHNYTWEVHPINFDMVFTAYLSLLQVATFKGWTEVIIGAVDSSHLVEGQPKKEQRVGMYLYFVLFIVFGSFFTLNLFIGVIIDNFNMQKKKAGGSLEMFMTEDQKKYYNAMKKLGSKAPQKPIPKPKFKCQLFFFKVTTNQKFDIGIMIVIVLNMFTMGLEHYGQDESFTEALNYVNLVFIVIFTLEGMMKLLGLRHYYFKQPWNVFDFAVVVMSILGVAFQKYMESFLVSPTLLRVVRVFRVGRVLRLVKSAKGIRTLLFSLAVSLPALFNIGLLLFLVMFIYAIFCMNFFMRVKHSYGIDDMFNFETFGRSMIVLFQMCTSAGWAEVLAGLINTDDCKQEGTEDLCGSKPLAVVFVVSYLVVSYLVVINMYIAVILENFSQATEDVQQGLTQDDFDMYYEIWEKFDEKATQYIPLERLSEFVDALEEPLQIQNPNYYKLVSFEITICEGEKVHCVDILDALTKHFLGTSGEDMQDVKKGPTRKDYIPCTNTLRRQRQIVCARIIQRAWRNRIRDRKAARAAAAARAGTDVIVRIDEVTESDRQNDNVQRNSADCDVNETTPLVIIHCDSSNSPNNDDSKAVELGPNSDSVV